MFEEQRQPTQLNGIETMGNALRLTAWLIAGVGMFWMMCVRKFGTMGTMTNAVPFLIELFVLVTLFSGAPMPDMVLFQGAIYLLIALVSIHFWSAVWARRKRHVHTYHLGLPRFKGGLATELILGLAVSAAFYYFAPLFGAWLGASVLCSTVFTEMINRRDKWRMYVMRDRIKEQERMVELYGG